MFINALSRGFLWLINMLTPQPSDVLSSIPTDLPIPIDDGACQHLENKLMPDITLPSTDDERVNLSQLTGWNVLFCYPMTGCPGHAIPNGWVQIPGAAGCTPQVCSYRENLAAFKSNHVGVFGVSSQTPETQKEAAIRLELSYPLLSDSMYSFSSAMELPMIEVAGKN